MFEERFATNPSITKAVTSSILSELLSLAAHLWTRQWQPWAYQFDLCGISKEWNRRGLMHWKFPTEVKSVQAGWLAGQRQPMQCRKRIRLNTVTSPAADISGLPANGPIPFPTNTLFKQGTRIRIYQACSPIPFSADTLSKDGLPHPSVDPPLVPRQPHHPPHPAQRWSFKRRPSPTRGEEKVRTVVVFYTECWAHTKLSK